MENELKSFDRLPIFQGITGERIAPLCRTLGCYTRQFGAGEILWQRGDRVSAAGIVLSGGVQAEQNGTDGVQHIVAHHGVGSLFGDILMSSQMQRSPVDVVACGKTTVLFLPLERIMRDCGRETATEQARFRLNLLSEISDKYWALYQRTAYLSEQTMRGRLIKYFITLCQQQESNTITLPETRESMAAVLCVNRSAMCRELGRMCREGLIVLSRRECALTGGIFDCGLAAR